MTTDEPGLAVIVPLHNGAATILDTLQSLACQTVPPDETIVVDDGSSDGGPDLVRAHFPGVRVVRLGRNRGVGYARNTGALTAGSELVAFLDQDDVWLPARCARMKKLFTENPTWDVVATGVHVFATVDQRAALAGHPFESWVQQWAAADRVQALADELDPGADPPTSTAVPLRRLLGWTITVTTTYVLRRATFHAVGGCATWLRSADDWVLLQNLARHTVVHEVNDRSLLYRVHSRNTSVGTDWARPLLVAAAAMRHGGGLVPGAAARDAETVGRLSESDFLMNLLLGLARSGSWRSAGDTLALVRLLATDSRDVRVVLSRLARAAAGRRRRRWWPSHG